MMSDSDCSIKMGTEVVVGALTCVGIGASAEIANSSSFCPLSATSGQTQMSDVKDEPMEVPPHEEGREDCGTEEEPVAFSPTPGTSCAREAPETDWIEEEPEGFSPERPVEPEACWINEDALDTGDVQPDTKEVAIARAFQPEDSTVLIPSTDIDPLLGPSRLRDESDCSGNLKEEKLSSAYASLSTVDAHEVMAPAEDSSTSAENGHNLNGVGGIREQERDGYGVLVPDTKCGEVRRSCRAKKTVDKGTRPWEKRYSCDMCELMFTCAVCDKKCIDRTHFIKHVRSHTGERQFPCNICGKQGRWRHQCGTHLKKSSLDERRFGCDLCEKTFCSWAKFVQHKEAHAEGCSISNIWQYSLLYSLHVTKDNPMRHSPNCRTKSKANRAAYPKGPISTTTTQEAALRKERPFACNTCPRRFRNRGYLTNHKKGHMCRQKPVRSYVHKGSLNGAEGEKLHSRSVGNGVQSESEILHLSAVQMTDFKMQKTFSLLQKKYGCDRCEKKFYRKDVLIEHGRLEHVGEKQ